MKHLRVVAVLAMLFLGATALRAASPLYWDPTGSSGTSLGGSGTWDVVSPNWYDGLVDVPWTNAPTPSDAIFSGTAGTVTLETNITASDIYFTNETGAYLITNNVAGTDVLTVNGTIDTGGGAATISAPIANSSTLNKNGNGQLTLTANSLSTLTGAVMINQGSVSVATNYGVGQYTSVTVSNGAALVLNGGTNGLNAFYPTVTINGSGITNTGSLQNLSGVTTFYGQIVLGTNNSMIYVDTDSALVYDGESGPLTDNGNNYNLVISGSGTGNFQMGATSIGGTLIVKGPASCYCYLNSITPTAWPSTYVGPGASLYVENNNSFGTQPATLMTTNVILDGGTITSGGTYTMYATDGITVTTNNGTLVCNSGTWTTCNLYSESNGSITLTNTGSFRPAGAAGTTTGAINLGTGSITKNGSGDCNLTYANATLEVYSNLVLLGGSISFNYDQSSGEPSNLGALPATLNPSNIVFNGGSLHVGHSTTLGATRGIFVGPSGGTIEDVVSSGGTVTIDGPISGPGSMNFPNGHSGTTSTIILAANNTYTGTTTAGASCNVTVGSGGSTGTLGTGNTSDSSILTFNRTGSYSYGGVISGTGSVVNSGSGTITLTGANTYSGNTTNSTGTLLISNTSGSGTGTGVVQINSGTLGGSGTISGAVTLASGSTLALGLNKLTINNSLSFAGSVTASLNKSLTPSNGMAVVSGTITRTGTGTITVTNLGSALVAGDTFQLFSQAVSGGGSMTISGGGTGVTWNNNLAVNGTISVLSATLPTPHFNQVQITTAGIVLSGTNGPGSATYYLFSSTNLALPFGQWTSIATNTFLSNGQFSITNAITPGNPQQFYLLQAQ